MWLIFKKRVFYFFLFPSSVKLSDKALSVFIILTKSDNITKSIGCQVNSFTENDLNRVKAKIETNLYQGVATTLNKAFQLAKSFDSKLWLMHIAAPNPDFVGYEAGPQYIRDNRGTELRKEHKLLQKYWLINLHSFFLNQKNVNHN